MRLRKTLIVVLAVASLAPWVLVLSAAALRVQFEHGEDLAGFPLCQRG